MISSHARAQTATLNASALALRSGGAISGGDVTLDANGYLGTYVTLAAPGQVTINLQAAGVAAPHVNLVVNDFKHGFDVAGGFNNYQQTLSLPAGTHFVRAEFSNDTPAAPTRAVTMRSLQISGATVANAGTSANALSAADTYINQYRMGNVSVSVSGPGGATLLPGTPVRAKLVRHAFNFGGTVSGSSLNDSKDMLAANPAAGSEAYKFQQFINRNFNTIVPSNAGKWSNNEPTQNSVNMTLVDKQLNYAAAHHMEARMHTLIWGSGATSGNQQPNFVNALISSAASGNATAKANLSAAIASRINYYAGTNGNRARKYVEIDVLNESLHNPSYWNIYGAAGTAAIYDQVAAAINASGADARTYINEWNVLQYSPQSISNTGAATGSDPYANWYRQHAQDILAAGGDLSGIGIQYYASVTQTGSQAHNAATIEKALQNLAVTGLPLSMTEFGLASGTTKANSQALGPQVLEESMRMFFGNPAATTFMIWGWWDLSTGPYAPAALLDNSLGNNSLTPMGQRWEALMSQWNTDLTPTVGADGAIDFNGFWGDYNLGDATSWSNLELVKGTSNYALQLSAPPTWSIWNPSTAGAWSSAGNWSIGGVAGGAGDTAYFGSAGSNRSINLAAPVTLGQMVFDSAAGAYTLDGQMLSLQGFAGVAAIQVITGTHRIDAELRLLDDTTIAVASAGSTLTVSRLLDSPAIAITKRGDGVLAVDHLNVAGLRIESGSVRITDASRISIVRALELEADAQLDLGWSSLVVDDAPGADPLAAIGELVAATRIVSSMNGDVTRFAVAVGTADAIGLAGYGDTALLLRLTRRGDADLDGVVGFADLLRLARHYGLAGTVWTDGDFTGDGVVNFNDLLALAKNYGQGLPAQWESAGLVVPEPGSIGAMAVLLALSGCRVRRCRPLKGDSASG